MVSLRYKSYETYKFLYLYEIDLLECRYLGVPALCYKSLVRRMTIVSIISRLIGELH